MPYGDIFRTAHLKGECDFIYIMHSLVPTAGRLRNIHGRVEFASEVAINGSVAAGVVPEPVQH